MAMTPRETKHMVCKQLCLTYDNVLLTNQQLPCVLFKKIWCIHFGNQTKWMQTPWCTVMERGWRGGGGGVFKHNVVFKKGWWISNPSPEQAWFKAKVKTSLPHSLYQESKIICEQLWGYVKTVGDLFLESGSTAIQQQEASGHVKQNAVLHFNCQDWHQREGRWWIGPPVFFSWDCWLN